MGDKQSVFAVGDIHGCAAELRALLSILPIDASSTVVFLGDYIDRGPSSKEVVDVILELKRRCRVVTLMGNHESMLLEFLDGSDPRKVARFIYNGGSSTLASYADESGAWHMPPQHLAFFRELRMLHDDGANLFVHAGLPDVPIAKIDPKEHAEHLLWIRREFFESRFPWARRVVHGHTPVREVEIHERRINLDTGCVYGRELSAIELPSLKVYSVPRQLDDEPRVYLKDQDGRRQAMRFSGAVTVRVDNQGRVLDFVTIDYSEIGMAIRQDGEAPVPLEVGQEVRGVVGDPDDFQISFTGKVVRFAREGDSILYGIAIVEKKEVLPARGAPGRGSFRSRRASARKGSTSLERDPLTVDLVSLGSRSSASTLEGAVDQYLSMVQEKEVAGPSARDPRFSGVASSSELTACWAFPGIRPTFEVGDVRFGAWSAGRA